MNATNFKINKQKFFVYIALPICCFLAFINLYRTPAWSYDVIEYQIVYERIINTNIRSLADFFILSFEPAFVLSSIISGYFTKNVNLILFMFSLASLVIKLVYIPALYVRKSFVLIATYVLTYYILLELTQNRVAIASAFILLGYHFLVTDRRVSFVIAVLFASSFHYSAVFAFIALLFDNQIDKYLIKRHMIVLILLYLLSIALTSSLLFTIIELFDAKKASYLNSADTDLGSGPLRIAFIVLYQTLILLVCRPSIVKRATPAVVKFHRLLFHMYAVSISFYLALNSLGVVAVRLAEVFRNVEPFLLVVTLSSCLNIKKPLLVFVIFISIFVNLQKNNYVIYPINMVFKAIGLTERNF